MINILEYIFFKFRNVHIFSLFWPSSLDLLKSDNKVWSAIIRATRHGGIVQIGFVVD